MAIREVVVRPPYSVVFVGDRESSVPATTAGSLVSATNTCLAIGTRSDVDGPTRVRLIDATDEVADVPQVKAFDGTLAAKSHELTIASVDGHVYLRRELDDPSIGLKVYVDDETEPTDICVVVD